MWLLANSRTLQYTGKTPFSPSLSLLSPPLSPPKLFLAGEQDDRSVSAAFEVYPSFVAGKSAWLSSPLAPSPLPRRRRVRHRPEAAAGSEKVSGLFFLTRKRVLTPFHHLVVEGAQPTPRNQKSRQMEGGQVAVGIKQAGKHQNQPANSKRRPDAGDRLPRSLEAFGLHLICHENGRD